MDAQGFLVQEAERRRYYGVYTQQKSRDSMFTLLMSHMDEYRDKFITKNITSDILTLVRNKRGKIVASSTAHDDSIMSYLIALYVYYYGNNLYRYGFVRGQLPSEDERNKGMEYEDVYEHMNEETKEFFGYAKDKTIQDYQNNIQQEIIKARQQMASFDSYTTYNASVNISNMDIDVDGYDSPYINGLDFDDLND